MENPQAAYCWAECVGLLCKACRIIISRKHSLWRNKASCALGPLNEPCRPAERCWCLSLLRKREAVPLNEWGLRICTIGVEHEVLEWCTNEHLKKEYIYVQQINGLTALMRGTLTVSFFADYWVIEFIVAHCIWIDRMSPECIYSCTYCTVHIIPEVILNAVNGQNTTTAHRLHVLLLCQVLKDILLCKCSGSTQ